MNPIVLAAQEVIYFKHYCKLWTTEGLIWGKWRAFLLVAVLVTNRGKDIIFSIGVKSNHVFTLMKRHTSYYASGISGWLVASQNLLFYFHVSPHPLEVVVIYVNIFFFKLNSAYQNLKCPVYQTRIPGVLKIPVSLFYICFWNTPSLLLSLTLHKYLSSLWFMPQLISTVIFSGKACRYNRSSMLWWRWKYVILKLKIHKC